MQYDRGRQALKGASTVLKAMSNENRLLILYHLAQGEHSVGELCDLVGLSQSALSQHLAKLRRDGLVHTRRAAQTVYYRVTSDEVLRLLDTLHELFRADPNRDP